MILLDCRLEGAPASFATRGEAPWKDTLTRQLAGIPTVPGAAYLELEFDVEPRRGYPNGADLDNLCEPLFSVLVNRIGWFDGRRPEIRGWRARKAVASSVGTRLRISDTAWESTSQTGRTLLDLSAPGPLPTHAQDVAFADRVRTAMLGRPVASAELAVALAFDGRVNLGDIATGRVKNLIDCLWPVIGGRSGAPDDARISVLEVTRRESGHVVGVQVGVVELVVPVTP